MPFDLDPDKDRLKRAWEKGGPSPNPSGRPKSAKSDLVRIGAFRALAELAQTPLPGDRFLPEAAAKGPEEDPMRALERAVHSALNQQAPSEPTSI